MTQTVQALRPPTAAPTAPTGSCADQVKDHRQAVRWRRALEPFGKALVVAFLVAVVTFILGKLMLGDPGRLMLGPYAPQDAVEALNRKLGVDQPLLSQFWSYLGGLAHGRLGDSFAYEGMSVWQVVGPALATSCLIAVLTAVVSVLLALVAGLVGAGSASRSIDVLVKGASLVGLSAPPAFVALVLILVVAVKAGALPAGGWGSAYPDNFRYLILPVATLAIGLAPVLIRIIRERAAEILDEAHIEAAIARGVPMWRIMWRHVLPNSAGPLLAVLGANIGALLSGAVVVDVIFGLPGLGRLASNAIGSGDVPVIQGVALMSGLVVTGSNLLAEMLQRAIDPRLRQ